MRIEYDLAKDARNFAERGISFEAARDFDFATAIFEQDTRKEYGEVRINAFGYIENRLHMLCFKPLGRLHIRVISLRKCNERERKRYEKNT